MALVASPVHRNPEAPDYTGMKVDRPADLRQNSSANTFVALN